MRVLSLALLLLTGTAFTSFADGDRQPPVLDQNYKGSHKTEFVTEFDRVRLLTQQAQLEVSSRLGLMNYRDGFIYPLTISFVDGVPPGLESALAYVQLSSGPTGIAQNLKVNLTQLSAHPV